MEKIDFKATNLFRIELVNRRNGNTTSKMVNKDSLDFYINYWSNNHDINIIENIPSHTVADRLRNIEVFYTGGNSGRCYVSKNYTVKSDRELFNTDLDMLRALKLFLNGQRHAELISQTNDNGTYYTKLVSERDSSD